MTAREPTDASKVDFVTLIKGADVYTFGKYIPKKKEPVFSVRLGWDFLKDLFKKYLSEEDYRNEIFSEAEGVNKSLLQLNGNFEYFINKATIQMILKKNLFNSKYLRLEDNILMDALECALNELQEEIKEGVDYFLIEEMQRFEIAKNQKIAREEIETECKKVIVELIVRLDSESHNMPNTGIYLPQFQSF